jgi:hypothetical protein
VGGRWRGRKRRESSCKKKKKRTSQQKFTRFLTLFARSLSLLLSEDGDSDDRDDTKGNYLEEKEKGDATREREKELKFKNARQLKRVRSPPSLSLPPLPFSHLFFSPLSNPNQRAEHNDGVLHSLEELSLNQLGLINLGFVVEEKEQQGSIEGRRRHRRRSLLPRACRRLRHLSLAGNSLLRLPCGPRDLGRCKELKTLNVALNAIESVGGGSAEGEEGTGRAAEDEEGPLSSCESLERLDLSGNFISKPAIRETLRSLASAPALERLSLVGCPVAVGWSRYRSFVVASLPRLRELVSFFFRVCFVSPFEKREKAHVVRKLNSLFVLSGWRRHHCHRAHRGSGGSPGADQRARGSREAK